MLLPLCLVLVTGLAFVRLADAVDCQIEPMNTDARLRKAIFCSYDKSVLPVKKSNTKIVVDMMMALKAIDFNDHSNTMDVSSWLALSWNDEYLRWSPADYDNIDSIVESSDTLWQPDLALYNSNVASIESQFCRSASCVVNHDGRVSCIPPCQLTAHCASNYLRWPFDTQNCSLQIGTWVHDGNDVDYKLRESHVPREAALSENGEWQLREARSRYNEGKYDNISYPTVEYSFQLERHSATHAGVIMVPAVVIMVLNLITLWLSPACIERLALVSLNLFFHFTYMQQLSWYVPANGNVVPLVLIFYQTSLLMTVVLLVVAVVTRGLNQSKATVPAWIGTSITYVESIRFGRICLRQSYLVESQPLNADSIEANMDDVVLSSGHSASTGELSDVQANNPEPGKAHKSNRRTVAESWRIAVRLIDRVLFVVLFVVYVLMMVEWLPEGYLTKPAVGDVAIVAPK